MAMFELGLGALSRTPEARRPCAAGTQLPIATVINWDVGNRTCTGEHSHLHDGGTPLADLQHQLFDVVCVSVNRTSMPLHCYDTGMSY